MLGFSLKLLVFPFKIYAPMTSYSDLMMICAFWKMHPWMKEFGGLWCSPPPPSPSIILFFFYFRSGAEWICQLMFQGPEQRMISSTEAKDKANKSLVFCWAKPKKRKKKRAFLSHLSSCSAALVLREPTLSANLCYTLLPRLSGPAD